MQLAGEAEGQDQHHDVEVEGDEVADLEVAVEHLMAAVPEDGGERERGEEVERGQEAGPQASGDERAFEHRVGFGVEAVDLELLGAETLDRADAGHRLLDDGRQVAELLLLFQADGREPSREAGGHHVEQWQRAEREQREHRARQHHHDDHADEDEEARQADRTERQPLADLVEVGVGVGHELPGLRLVVVREVQQLQVREQPGAEVGLHPVRHAERAVSAHAHARALEHADEDDQARVLERLAGVARHDALVDGGGDEQRDRQLGARPQQRGEHAEDEESPLGAEGVSEEAPSLAAQHLVAVGQPLRTATHTTSNTVTDGGQATKGPSASFRCSG